MKCAFCNATLAADATQCPACGTWQKTGGEDGSNTSDLDHQDEIETTSKMFSSLMPASSHQAPDNEYPFSSLQIAATLERDEPGFAIPFEMPTSEPTNTVHQGYSQPSFTTDFDSLYKENAENQENTAFQDLSRLSPTITPSSNLGFPSFTPDFFDSVDTLAVEEAAQITGAFPMELLSQSSENPQPAASTSFAEPVTPLPEQVDIVEKTASDNVTQADDDLTPMLTSYAQEEMASWETAFSMLDEEATFGTSSMPALAKDQSIQDAGISLAPFAAIENSEQINSADISPTVFPIAENSTQADFADISPTMFPAAENIEQSNFMEYFSMPAPQQLPEEEDTQTARPWENKSAAVSNNISLATETNRDKPAEKPEENKSAARPEETSHQYDDIEDTTPVAQPFNLKTWLTPGKSKWIALIVLGIILVELPLLSPDWAQGALIGAILALLIICVLAIQTGRRWLGSNPRKPITQYAGRLALIAILLLYGGVGIFGQTALHQAQAHSLEGQQQWSSAIKEYELGGENLNSSEDIARTGIEWAEALAQQQNQNDALTQLNLVSNAAATNSALEIRLQKDKVQDLLALGNTANKQHSYAQATSNYDAILASSSCNASCRKQVSTADASAYYNLGESYLKQKNYSKAVTSFKVVETKFPSSSEVKREHADMAKALLGQGKTEIANTNTCSSALSNYQNLSTHYSDTPEGQEAQSALQGPQTITGHFAGTITTTVTGEVPAVVLVQNVTSAMTVYEISQLAYTNPYAAIDSNGNFNFTAQPQGTYGLIWGAFDASGTFHLATPSYDAQGNLAYNANVQPLCPFNFGTINATFTLED